MVAMFMFALTFLVPQPGETQPTSSSDSGSSSRIDKQGDASSTKPSSEADSSEAGQVVEVRPGLAVISLGSRDGLSRGDHVELFRIYEVDMAGDTTTSEETMAVGRVTALGEERAQVELGIDERVEAGHAARRTNRSLTASAIAPPRPAGVQSFAITIRPFLATGELAGGAVNHLSYKYAFEWPGLLEVQLNPATFALADGPDNLALAARASMSFDLSVFRIGLGLGVTRIAEQLTTPISSDATEESIRRTANLTIGQVLRLGARDGLHLELDNTVVLKRRSVRNGEFMFVYGGTTGDVQVPLNNVLDNTWLITRGGFHLSGQAFGELGLRFLASGNGSSGSLFFDATAGGVGVIGPEASYGGPMVGFGIEYRP